MQKKGRLYIYIYTMCAHSPAKDGWGVVVRGGWEG